MSRRILPFVVALLFAGACSAPEQYELTFASDREETLDLVGMSADSSYFVHYTGDEGTEYNPAWSPDGRSLAYTRWRGSNADIFVFEPERGWVGALVESPAYDAGPKWSPDGRSVLFVSDRDGTRGVYRYLLDDSLVVRLSPFDVTDIGPEYSPDGASIAFSRSAAEDPDRSVVMIMDADGNGARAVTSGAGQDALPSWDPNSKRLAFHRCVESRCSLWMVNADGSGEKPLLQDDNDNRWPAFSPDGSWIAFTHRIGSGTTDIWVVRPDGTDARRVTFWPGADEGATWNPVIIEARKPPLHEE